MYPQNNHLYHHPVLTLHFLMSLYFAVDYIGDSGNDEDYQWAMKYQWDLCFELQKDLIHPMMYHIMKNKVSKVILIKMNNVLLIT